MELVEHMIQEQNLLKDKVLMILLYPGDIDRNIAGLVANKLMAKYQRPCCILTRVEANNKVSYQGSARGCDKAGIVNFKDICEATGCIMYAEGHQGAFGLGIELGCLSNFLDRTNEALSDMSNEVIYYVDYIYDGINVNPQQVLDIGTHTELWGKDVDEPYIAIENLKITKDMLTLMSPDKKPTLKITLPNKVTIVKFNSSQEEYESLYSELGYIAVDIIGRCNANKFGYSVYPQIIIEDYEIVGQAKFIF
jgi:single-stranded-DNA-specific exonuclease